MIEQPQEKRKTRRWIIILLAVALILTILLLDSRYRLTVTDYDLAYENLPEAFADFKIVQLTDLHMAQFGEGNQRLLDMVREQEPDIIALTGDFINRAGFRSTKNQSESLRGFFEEVAQIAPCYFVSGNHEWASGELGKLTEVLEESGVRYLRNEYIFLEKQGERIILAGVEDPNGPAGMIEPDKLVEKIRDNYPEEFILFLGHRDFWLEKYPALEVNLVLSGHAHGGVVRLPFIGGVFGTEFRLFPKYDAGLFNEGGYDFILSRGLGNYNIIPRFLNPPEIVTVTLHSKGFFEVPT